MGGEIHEALKVKILFLRNYNMLTNPTNIN